MRREAVATTHEVFLDDSRIRGGDAMFAEAAIDAAALPRAVMSRGSAAARSRQSSACGADPAPGGELGSPTIACSSSAMLQEIFSIEPGIDRILPLGTFSRDAGRTVAVTALNVRGRLLRQP